MVQSVRTSAAAAGMLRGDATAADAPPGPGVPTDELPGDDITGALDGNPGQGWPVPAAKQ